MRIKQLLINIARTLLRFVFLGIIVVVSFRLMAMAFFSSSDWLAEEIDDTRARDTSGFYVAYTDIVEGNPHIAALRYSIVIDASAPVSRTFRLDDTQEPIKLQQGEGSISISSRTSEDGIQTTIVHVVGDTPWASVSEYQVIDETIVPVRFGWAAGWLLLATLIVPVALGYGFRKPVGKLVDRILRIKTE